MKLHHTDEFFFHLFGSAVDVGVVHCQSPNPQQTRQFSGLFITIAGPIFGKSQG